MKKNYFLVALLIFLGSAITGMAQSYSLKDLTPEQFTSGGSDQWSFERHDVNAGVYAAFTMYGDSSTAVNFYDPYITERFGLYPIMNRPASGTQFEVKRNAWYSSKSEFAYVAAEYPTGTLIGENLTYGVNYPDSLSGYEVYSNSLTAVNSAITFTVPADGYYRVDMSLRRMDPSSTIGEMTAKQYFRYGGTGAAFPMGQGFLYGKTKGIDTWAAGNEVLYSQYLAKIPESPTVNTNSGKPYRWLPSVTAVKYLYFYAKSGDKISFETDARSTGNGENTPRGAYARTKWINLAVAVSDEATATADAMFVNPYFNDPALTDSLNNVLGVAEAVISDSKYSLFSRNTLEAVYTNIDNRMNAGAVLSMEIPSLIDQLQKAIAVCLASEGGLKVRYTFDNVANGVVPDLSGQGNNGTLVNNASIVTLGKYNVLDLGTANGYLDMGTKVGSVISTMSSFTISAYYRVDPAVTLSGAGLFLWTFTTQAASSASSGQYIYYQLQNQRLAITKTAGWNSEAAVTLATKAKQNEWQHVVYTQDGADGKLYINGALMKENLEMPIPSATFTAPTTYNWIGRPGFNDPYLKSTLVYDVRLYNYAVNVDSITKWNGVVADLEIATNTSTDGDYHVLDSLATAYTNLLPTYTIGVAAGTYPQSAKDSFTAAIATAQALSVAHTSSQLKINSEVLNLKSAYQTFLAAKNADINTLAEGKYYITLTDSLYLTNLGMTLIANGSNLTIANGGLSTTKVTTDSTQVWKLSKVTSLDPARFSVFSALNEGGVYRHLTEGSVIQNNWGTPGGGIATGDDDWRTFNILYDGNRYAFACAGKGLTNSKKGYLYYDVVNKKLSASAAGSAAAYEFNFVSINTGINDVANSGVRIFEANNAIRVTTEESAVVSVYTTTGTMITKITVDGTQSINVPAGIYIVKVVGRTSVVGKVIVNK